VSDPPAGFVVSCSAAERLTFSGAELRVLASAGTTGGAFTVIEEVDPLDTPAHVHAHEDELFYVLDGEHVFEVGGAEVRVGPGAVVYAPRGAPHAHRRVRPRKGRFLTVTLPAGLEGFFRELHDAEESGSSGPETYASASERYGITWLD
jgi:mannose-6-phosphate isomerase-like protein (cupin superfamily)